MQEPIAYTYDADTHCPGCAAEYAGGQDALDANIAEDREGNTIGAIFSWTEWFQIDGRCESLVCGTCRGEIATAHNDPHSMGCPDFEPDWPPTDQEAAQREGWDVFHNGDQEHEPFTLNRIDDPEGFNPTLGIAEPVFADDTEAWEHVIARAAEGTDLHNRALLFLAAEAPGELVHIAYFRVGIEPCPCVGCTTAQYRGGRTPDNRARRHRMTAFRLTRAGAVDLEFTGECLADVSSRERDDQQRWSEIRIYRTDSGKYVTEMIGRSTIRDEIDLINVKVVERPEEIRGALSRKGDNRHTKVPGNPSRPYLTELAIEAMQVAGESDEAIAAILVERI